MVSWWIYFNTGSTNWIFIYRFTFLSLNFDQTWKELRQSERTCSCITKCVRSWAWYILFWRYGRVEKVKLLIKTSPDGAKAAFVDFVDIRSATKANEAQNRIGDRDLRTNFNEPGANKNHQYQRMHGGYPGG